MYSGEKPFRSLLTNRFSKSKRSLAGGSSIKPVEPFNPVKIIAPVEVVDSDLNILFSCRQVSSDAGEVVLERLPTTFSLDLIEPGTDVLLRTYTSDLKEVQKKGKIKSSTRTNIVVGNLEDLNVLYDRSDFRQPLNVEGLLYRSESDYLKISIPCTVVNICKNGACIKTKENLHDEQVIIIRVEIYPGSGPISFRGQVIRKEEYQDSYRYGILFEQLTQRKLHDLTVDLEELRHMIEKRTYK